MNSATNRLSFDEDLKNLETETNDKGYAFKNLKKSEAAFTNIVITIPYNAKQTKIIPLQKLHNRIIKRSLDITISLFAIIFFLSWMIPIFGLLIKLESKGGIFFKQLRSGRHNKTFLCYKFRSMYINKQSDELQAKKDDSRITRIGAFLRKTSLDEFPQFINVLKGEMSIVGPRPHMLKHTEEYGNMVQNYMNRLMVKQGLTGWAQTNGYRGETPELPLMEERIKHDLWYMENWSVKLDLKIIWLTLGQVFKGAL